VSLKLPAERRQEKNTPFITLYILAKHKVIFKLTIMNEKCNFKPNITVVSTTTLMKQRYEAREYVTWYGYSLKTSVETEQWQPVMQTQMTT